MKAKLFVLGGRDVGASFELDRSATVGRDRACEVRLKDRSISRRHAEFRFEGLDWIVEDLDSRNGLHVGGRRVARAVLHDHEEIVLGDVPLRVRFEGAEDPPADVAGSEATLAPDDDIEIEDEILLDADPGPSPPRVASADDVPHARTAGPAPSVGARPTPAKVAPPSTLSSSDLRRAEILREGKRTGLLRGDLAQQPAWVRAVIAVVIVAAAGAIVVGTFRLVQSMRATL